MNTGTGPRLEQLDFFYGFCLVRESVPKPKPHRALTYRETDVLKQARALNDPLIIEAINLFNAEVQDVIWECDGTRRSQTGELKVPQSPLTMFAPRPSLPDACSFVNCP
jgi:hypothetical protein